ncbi:MAG TPA: anti-sigma factor antagonist [Solirubrobacteraceae bacterium]|nr:anti-sigma factor antagonist [Solirubrobacteraceae bacterium]
MPALPNFRIETFQSESGTTIKLTGELDSATCAALIELFEETDRPPGTRHVVLDLAGVSFMDSAGMRAMIVIERIATERELSLTVSPPPTAVTELLRATGIADHVTLAPRSDEARPNAPLIERIELELPRDPRAPGRARAELRGVLPGRISDADRATLTLLTSELVTNAVIHPASGVPGAVELRISAYADRVRVEVGDAGSGFDLQTLAPRPRESGGHGLIVVEGLSSRWGTRRRTPEEGDGFCVWFELEVDYAPEATRARETGRRRVAAAEG